VAGVVLSWRRETAAFRERLASLTNVS